VFKHKFQSVVKRYTPPWSVFPVLGFKCVCPALTYLTISEERYFGIKLILLVFF
jgi:hypothetical protein